MKIQHFILLMKIVKFALECIECSRQLAIRKNCIQCCLLDDLIEICFAKVLCRNVFLSVSAIRVRLAIWGLLDYKVLLVEKYEIIIFRNLPLVHYRQA